MSAEPEQQLFCCAVAEDPEMTDEMKVRLIHQAAHTYWRLLEEINDRMGDMIATAKEAVEVKR